MRVQCQKDGPVWRIALEPGPDGRVLLDRAGVAALGALLDESTADGGCRVLVLEGRGEIFCEGLDLEDVLGLEPAELERAVHAFAGCLTRLRQTRQVVMALIDGAASGGGVGLAAAADLLLATSRASFALPELALGLLPAVVLPVLHERMAPQRARLLALSERISAEQALALGLVDRVVADGAGLEQALRGAVKHALRLQPTALGELKRLWAERVPLPLGAALERGADRTTALLLDAERTRPIRAFLEGEPLPWFERPPPRRSP